MPTLSDDTDRILSEDRNLSDDTDALLSMLSLLRRADLWRLASVNTTWHEITRQVLCSAAWQQSSELCVSRSPHQEMALTGLAYLHPDDAACRAGEALYLHLQPIEATPGERETEREMHGSVLLTAPSEFVEHGHVALNALHRRALGLRCGDTVRPTRVSAAHMPACSIVALELEPLVLRRRLVEQPMHLVKAELVRKLHHTYDGFALTDGLELPIHVRGRVLEGGVEVADAHAAADAAEAAGADDAGGGGGSAAAAAAVAAAVDAVAADAADGAAANADAAAANADAAATNADGTAAAAYSDGTAAAANAAAAAANVTADQTAAAPAAAMVDVGNDAAAADGTAAIADATVAPATVAAPALAAAPATVAAHAAVSAPAVVPAPAATSRTAAATTARLSRSRKREVLLVVRVLWMDNTRDGTAAARGLLGPSTQIFLQMAPPSGGRPMTLLREE